MPAKRSKEPFIKRGGDNSKEFADNNDDEDNSSDAISADNASRDPADAPSSFDVDMDQHDADGKREWISTSSINSHLVCSVCDGYFKDAHTIIECLHTFCKSCIYIHFNQGGRGGSYSCPKCLLDLGPQPMQSLRYDRTIQELVNNVHPELEEHDLEMEAEFYLKLGIPNKLQGDDDASSEGVDDKAPYTGGMIDEYVVVDKEGHFICPFPECDKKYTLQDSLKRHMLQKHAVDAEALPAKFLKRRRSASDDSSSNPTKKGSGSSSSSAAPTPPSSAKDQDSKRLKPVPRAAALSEVSFELAPYKIAQRTSGDRKFSPLPQLDKPYLNTSANLTVWHMKKYVVKKIWEDDLEDMQEDFQILLNGREVKSEMSLAELQVLNQEAKKKDLVLHYRSARQYQ